MRLVAVELNGFRRFAVNAETNGQLEVDGPLTAIVGPNEAGKTSLLVAMSRLNDEDAIDLERDRTRLGGVSDNQTVVAALFLLEADDRTALHGYDGGGDPLRCRWLMVSKKAGGQLGYELRPGLVRDRGPRHAARHAFRATRDSWSGSVESDALANAEEALDEEGERLEQYRLDALSHLAAVLESHSDEAVAKLVQKLRAAHDAESTHPNDLASRELAKRVPKFELFDERRPELLTNYDLSELVGDPPEQLADHPPAALADLARLGALDLVYLRNLLVADDSGHARTALDEATSQLRTAFAAWSQGDTRVYAQIERLGGTAIRIHVSNPAGGLSPLDERSDGLKTFAAMLAMTARHDLEIPPIVLIDELERHLHYDAQADVVQVLTRQDAIPQIVYTTHSAGCLPEDLGAGVRMVGPIEGTNHSRIKNRFWTTEGEEHASGFSPLLVGMGASTLAFVPVRNAVLSEGPTEIVLLPTLLRESLDVKSIGFQVAPASASAPEAIIAGLSQEAPRVVWLVDGDEAGRRIRRRLIRQRVDPARVIPLGGDLSGTVLEDVLLPSVYARAINAQLARSGVTEEFPASALIGVNRPRVLRDWCRAHRVAQPPKVDVANRVLDLRNEVPRLLNADGKRTLISLHERISAIFEAHPIAGNEES